MLRPTKPSVRSARRTTCLAWPDGRASGPLVVRAGVDDHVGRLDAAALDLEVAAHARAELLLGDAAPVGARRGQRIADDGAALDVDQVLVVRAGDLVLVARRRVAAGVALEEPRVAARVVLGLPARAGLGVRAGHDHDPVVVARAVDGGLDVAEAAPLGQPAVDRQQAAGPGAAHGDPPLARAQDVAAGARAAQRRPDEREGARAVVALADDAHVAGARPGDRRGERARRGDLPAGGGGDRPVRRRVGPVRRPLEVRPRGGGGHEADQGRDERDETADARRPAHGDPPRCCGRGRS
jgi:hypothetical protein